MKRALLWCGSVLFLPVTVLCWLFSLMRNRGIFAQSDVIVMNWHMANFGTSLATLDIARRILADRKAVFVLVWEPSGTQNPLVGMIFQDITVVTIRRVRPSFRFAGRNFCFPDITSVDEALARVTKLFFDLVFSGKEFLLPRDVRFRIPVPADLSDVIPPDRDDSLEERDPYEGFVSNCLWASLLHEGTSPPPRLPEQPRRDIHDRLTSARGGRVARLCMMYNRVLEENIHRKATSITDYLPAIELLVGHGFQVLLAGDQTLERDQMDRFGGMVVDAAELGVDLNMFRMFAPLESDIYIGDAGSGVALPMVMKMPSLTLNFHPFCYALPGTWVYPKRVNDEYGNSVPFRKVLREDPFGYYTPGGSRHKNWVPEENTSEEILDAVQAFLEGLDDGKTPEEDVAFEEDIPKLSMYYAFGARFSPAFLKRVQWADSRESRVRGESPTVPAGS